MAESREKGRKRLLRSTTPKTMYRYRYMIWCYKSRRKQGIVGEKLYKKGMRNVMMMVSLRTLPTSY